METEFAAAAGPEPDDGDVWHDSAEQADWWAGLDEEEDEGAAALQPDAAASATAAAAAFDDLCSLLDSLPAEQRTTLQEAIGVSCQSGGYSRLVPAAQGTVSCPADSAQLVDLQPGQARGQLTASTPA